MESVNFNHLYYFHVVAEQGSVTGAAKATNVTKPTVSAQVRQLEEFLGAELFDRRGGGMHLNEVGRRARIHTDVMFEAARSLMRLFRGAQVAAPQTLRVGVEGEVARAVSADFFTPLLGSEGVSLEIQRENGRSLCEALLALEIDLLVASAPPPGHEGMGLASVLLERSPLVAVVAARSGGGPSRGGPSRGGQSRDGQSRDGKRSSGGDDLSAAISERPILLYGKHTALHWAIDEWLSARNLHPRIAGYVDDVSTLVAMVRTSDAMAFVPRAALEPASQRALTIVGELDGLEAEVHALYVQRDAPRIVGEAVARLCRVEAPRSGKIPTLEVRCGGS